MLVGVASPLPALQNIGILRHKKAKLRINMRQSVHTLLFQLVHNLSQVQTDD